MYEKKHALPNKKIHTPKGIARLTVHFPASAALLKSYGLPASLGQLTMIHWDD